MMGFEIGLVSVLECRCSAFLACRASRGVRVYGSTLIYCLLQESSHPDSGDERCPWQPKKTRAQKMRMRDD